MGVPMQSDHKGAAFAASGPRQSIAKSLRKVLGRPEATDAALSKSAARAPDAGAWLANAEKVLGYLIEGGDPRIIGIAGDRSDAGSADLAGALARAYRLLGRKVILVDASRKDASPGEENQVAPSTPASLDLLAHVAVADGLHMVELRERDLQHVDAEGFRRACDAVKLFDNIIVNLQSLMPSITETSAAARVTGSACDAVVLVCLTAKATEPDLVSRIQACKLFGFKIAGLVLNDKDVLSNRLIGKLL